MDGILEMPVMGGRIEHVYMVPPEESNFHSEQFRILPYFGQSL